jgi:hypothetical protein
MVNQAELPRIREAARSNATTYYLAAQAPHLALQAPHLAMLLLAPHLLPVQARQAMAQPPRAAAVTTAEATALERVIENEFMKILLRVERKASV